MGLTGPMETNARARSRGPWFSGRGTALAAVLAALLCAAPPAPAQDGGPTPPRNKRPVRRPVIDLEKMARQPRPGQVLPGGEAPAEPAPAGVTPAAPAPTPEPEAAVPAESSGPSASIPSKPSVVPAPAEPADPVHAAVLGVDGPPAQVQWRRLDEAAADADDARWETIQPAASLDGRLEVRTGLAGAATLNIDGQAALRFGRLSRARLERRITGGRSEIVVHLMRGRVVVEPLTVDKAGLASTPVRVVTPAGTAVRRVAVEISYDAMAGMREQVLKRE